MSAENETQKLAEWFIGNWQGAIQEGTPVENAIRLLEEYKRSKE